MYKYLAEKDLIPKGNLSEIRFEDFEANPLAEVRRIYEELRLPGYTAAQTAFREHLESIEGYQKNRYKIDADTIRKVEKHWKFTVKHWGI